MSPLEWIEEKGRLTLRFNTTAKQREFLESEGKYRLFLGGVGSGKTTAGCLEVIRVALFYPTNLLVLRKTNTELRRSTLPVLEELLSVVGRVVPYTKNEDEQYIELQCLGEEGKSRIFWMGADNPDKLQGMNLGGFFVDEAREIEEVFWDVLRSRLRHPKGPRRGWLASLPPPAGHWLYRLFIRGEGGDEYKVIHATTFDNPFLPEDFTLELMRYDEWRYREFVLGEVVPSREGAPIFPDFDRKWHVMSEDKWKAKRVILERFLENSDAPYKGKVPVYRGIDFGFWHPAAVWVVLDDWGRVCVIDEFLGDQMKFEDFLAKLKQIDEANGYLVVQDFHDPHATYTTEFVTVNRVEIMKQHGLKPVAASSKFEDGIELMNRLLGTLIQGEPMLQVREKCRRLILGFEGEYCWDAKGKANKPTVVEHLMDALRYVVVGLWGRLSNRLTGVAEHALQELTGQAANSVSRLNFPIPVSRMGAPSGFTYFEKFKEG